MSIEQTLLKEIGESHIKEQLNLRTYINGLSNSELSSAEESLDTALEEFSESTYISL